MILDFEKIMGFRGCSKMYSGKKKNVKNRSEMKRFLGGKSQNKKHNYRKNMGFVGSKNVKILDFQNVQI